MKIVDLGRGLRGIVPDPNNPRDSLRSLTATRLRRTGMSEEAIKICMDYVRRHSGLRPDEFDDYEKPNGE